MISQLKYVKSLERNKFLPLVTWANGRFEFVVRKNSPLVLNQPYT